MRVLSSPAMTRRIRYQAARTVLVGAAPVATLDLAYYEVTNVAIRSWGDERAAARLRLLVGEIERAGQLVRADPSLLSDAAAIATEHGISAYDASYVAAARRTGALLVSCDIRDLVSKGLAVLPVDTLP